MNQAMIDQLHTLFFTKAKDLHTCEQLYYWRYHRHLIPKTKSPALTRGGYVHAVMHRAITLRKEDSSLFPDAALGLALITEEGGYPMTEEVSQEAKNMSLALWQSLHSYEVVESELVLNLSLPHGYVWKVKLDSIIALPDGMWQGEYKTTATYASNIKRLYHSGIQPFVYLHVARQSGWDLKGTKMFVVSKKESAVEDVIATPEQLSQAERFISETQKKLERVEECGEFSRNRTQCVTFLFECPYRSLCLEKAQEKYVEDVVNLLYDVESPLAHYGEGE